jgi:hypothetical protein
MIAANRETICVARGWVGANGAPIEEDRVVVLWVDWLFMTNLL